MQAFRFPPPAIVLPLLLGGCIGLGATAAAQPSAQSPAQPEEESLFLSAPAVPVPPTQRERVEPEVTIIETDEEVIYEYRVKGQVYMVKVEPVAGPPYYLMDTDGDGTLDVQDSREPNLALPQWLLFSW
ncbi:DUF2782 domain-containing protein [Thiohalocapsa halophila]